MDLLKHVEGVDYTLRLDPSNISLDASSNGIKITESIDITPKLIDISDNVSKMNIDASNIICDSSLNITADNLNITADNLNINADNLDLTDTMLNANVDVIFNENIEAKKLINADEFWLTRNTTLNVGRYIKSHYDHGIDILNKRGQHIFHHNTDNGHTYMYFARADNHGWKLRADHDGAYLIGKLTADGGNFHSSWSHWIGKHIHKHTYNHFNQWWGTTGHEGLSINCATNIHIGGVIFMSSDERIKTNITDANTSTALDLINQMKLSKYRYKDGLLRHSKQVYGFIAQQIKQVYPDAVSLVRDYIFDDMRFIDNPQWEKHNDKWKLYIEDIIFEDNHTGKCIFYTSETKDDDIKDNKFKIQVEDDKKSFIFDKKWNVVYLHSRQINDFHKLNKNAIYTIQHGAIQELSKRVDKLTEENKNLNNTDDLKEALAQKDMQIANLERRILTLEKKILRY
tara:strand:- start:110 stop:1480 length:1371 start_codon:yes stop_codon:yes gene_type:complete